MKDFIKTIGFIQIIFGTNIMCFAFFPPYNKGILIWGSGVLTVGIIGMLVSRIIKE